MGKLRSYEGKLPKRLGGNLVIYPMGGDIIIRLKSGFTTEELLHSKKYENCRKNASEFGRVSKACKGVREALVGILPRQNNLTIVNTFTKFMSSLLSFDTEHIKGDRTIATALQNAEALQLFTSYSFNPDTTLVLNFEVIGHQLQLSNFTLPEGISWMGFRLHAVAYDWDTFTGTLHSGGWHFEQHCTSKQLYPLPTLETTQKPVIYILEAQPFDEKEGAFIPVRTEEKGVLVVGYLENNGEE